MSDIKSAINADRRIELFALGSGQLCHSWETSTDSGTFVSCCGTYVTEADPQGTNDVVKTNWGIVDLPTSGGRLFAPTLFQPTSSYGISAAILQAEAAQLPARALGSGWSFSDVSFSQTSSFSDLQFAQDILDGDYADIWTHAGFALDIGGCSTQLDLSSVLLSYVDPTLLWFTEAGITVDELNNTLARLASPLALKTNSGLTLDYSARALT